MTEQTNLMRIDHLSHTMYVYTHGLPKTSLILVRKAVVIRESRGRSASVC